jgi:hypothetical protein
LGMRILTQKRLADSDRVAVLAKGDSSTGSCC